MIEKYGTVEMKDWGKDHWSVLAYVECRCVDFKGVLEYKHIRCNAAFHPSIPAENRYMPQGWHDSYSTRIKGSEQIRGHDDWDCMVDLQTAGLIEIVSMAHHEVKITNLGWEVASRLRKHKASGGVYANFQCNFEGLTV